MQMRKLGESGLEVSAFGLGILQMTSAWSGWERLVERSLTARRLKLRQIGVVGDIGVYGEAPSFLSCVVMSGDKIIDSPAIRGDLRQRHVIAPQLSDMP